MTVVPDIPAFEVIGLTKTLGRTEILKGLSFAVGEGGVAAIIGASGSGKSTLLRCLNMLISPDNGQVFWRGREIGWETKNGKRHRETERELLRYRIDVGMVFQNFNLFPHMTARENIIEAPKIVLKRRDAELAQEVRALLAKVRLAHRENAYPHQMSGGEQQRVAIARTLAMQPKALLFDEVTSALDPELKGEVLQIMRDLAADGMTMIMVSHEIGFVRQIADQVIFMHQGVVCEAGEPATVLSSPRTHELRAFLQSVEH